MSFLQEKIPALFATPNTFDVRWGLTSSITAVVLSVIWISWAPNFGRGPAYSVACVAFLLHAHFVLKHARNLLFIFRYLLLWVIGFAAALAWSMERDVLIAPFGAHWQTHDATVALVGSVMLATSGAAIGWFAAFLNYRKTVGTRITPAYVPLKTLRAIFLPLAFVSAIITVYVSGGFVAADKAYAEGQQSLGFEFGAANSIFLMSISIYFIGARAQSSPNLKLALALSALFILPMLAGNRADYLMQFAILLYVLYLGSLNTQNRNIQYPIPVLAIGAIILFTTASFISDWRTGHGAGLAATIDRLFTGDIFFQEQAAGLVLNIETANQMAGHFYSVFSRTDVLGEPRLWGKSYLDFLPRSVPAFFGTERPQDLAWEVGDLRGEVMAQGGIYEVAEAYWNFGYIGAFGVPLIITFIFANVLKRSLGRSASWFFWGVAFMTLMLMSPRAIWYQTFSYWRVGTVLIVFYFYFSYLRGASMRRARQNRYT